MTRKLDFWVLYKKFKAKVIKHFLLTTFRVLIWIILSGIIIEIFKTKGGGITENFNYANFLPEKLRSLLGKIELSKSQFIIGGLLLVLVYALVYYWNSSEEEELRIKGGHYTKNLVLDKFRRLPLEEKEARKDEVNNLIEKDASEIGYDWEHLPNHTFHSFLEIVLLLIFYWENFTQMTPQQIGFSLICLFLINIIVYFFTKKILRNEKKYKERLSVESAVINKERNNAILVESSGLTSQYRLKQKQITRANEKLLLDFNHTKSLNKAIPNYLLMESFPFLLLALSGGSFEGAILWAFWEIFGNFRSIFQCLWEYADYSSSRERINSFLALPEKNDNLNQLKLPLNVPITALRLENISFRYRGQKEWLVKNYNRNFSPGEINYLLGKNGTGKSTLLYLCLGLLVPQKGRIIVECANGKEYILSHQLNLQNWRAHNVAYCAHETLIEEGSTGQKQLTNINQTLAEKKSAQIFFFDEADNALDEDNQIKFKERIKKLVKQGKIVVCIEH